MVNKFPYETDRAEVGDVIQSREFTNCRYDYKFGPDKIPRLEKTRLYLCGKRNSYPLSYDRPGTPWDEPRIEDTLELLATDNSRGLSRFLVEEAGVTGASESEIQTHGGSYSGWKVTARRLNGDGTYNETNETVTFYQSGCFENVLPRVTVLDRYHKTFIKSLEERTVES